MPPSRFRPSKHTRAGSAGYVTTVVLLITLLLAVGAVAVLGMSLTQTQMARRSQEKNIALTLAESGLDDAVDQLRTTPTFTGTTTSLYENPPTNTGTLKLGTVVTTVTDIAPSTYTQKVVSVGTTTGGTSQTLVAVVQAKPRSLGDAAQKSNTNITINGNPTLQTRPLNNHTADIQANGNISMGGSSSVDGTLYAAVSVSGTGYYPSVSGAPSQSFPSTAVTNAWKAAWLSQAQAGGTVSAPSSDATISAPRYINGSISLKSKDHVTFTGSGVIYVNGDISLTGQSIITSGVTLVVSGTFSQAGGSTYEITTGSSQTPTMVVYNTFNQGTAVSLHGNSSATQQGVVYAISGDIDVAGNSTFVGALVAGGTGSIKSQGSFTQIFPVGMESPVQFPSTVAVTFVAEP